jgi:Arc/MetJ-type ribon-helix-helix transcriptional regulator
MGKPLTIQQEDDDRILKLKKKLKAKSKIDVIRRGLSLLESHYKETEKLERWKKATELVRKESQLVNQEFQHSSRLKRG